MMKKTTIFQMVITGIVIFLLLSSCDISGNSGSETKTVPNPSQSPCDDVSRVNEVMAPLNPEQDNCSARTLHIIKFKNTLYAIYLNTSKSITCTRSFQVYVSKQVCGDDWIRTNNGESLNISKTSIQYATNCLVRLIEYNNKLYALWQEHYGKGTVMHIKCYNESTDLWERVDGNEGLGLSGYYFTNPNVQHWAYFYYAGAVVYNNELYVAWSNTFNYTGGMAILKYDGCEWTEVPGVLVPGRETWGHRWIALTTHNNKLHLASVTRRSELTPSGQDDRRTYLEVYEFDNDLLLWTRISNQLNINIYDNAVSPSVISVNDTLYIAWREMTSSNPDYSALPYKIFVKEYKGGTTWEFTGVNPVASGPTFKPELLNYKHRLVLIYGENYDAYIKEYDGTGWVDVPGHNPITESVAMQGQGKFPILDVYSAVVADNKIYFAWRPWTDGDHYLCGYIDDMN